MKKQGYALTITYVSGAQKVILTNSLSELIQKVYLVYELENVLGGNLIKTVNVISSDQAMDAVMGIGAWANDESEENKLTV